MYFFADSGRKWLVLGQETRYSRTIVKTPALSRIAAASSRRSRGRAILQYALVAIGALLLVNALVGEKGLLEMMKARREYYALEQSLQRLRVENARLREEARLLKEDPATIEDLARRELGLIKPGEKLFIIRDVPSLGERP